VTVCFEMHDFCFTFLQNGTYDGIGDGLLQSLVDAFIVIIFHCMVVSPAVCLCSAKGLYPLFACSLLRHLGIRKGVF